MPFFNSKFSPKRPLSRKFSFAATATEDQLQQMIGDNRTINIRLGEQEHSFHNGRWMNTSEITSVNKTNTKLLQKIEELKEENNMLQLKYEMLMNMLVKTTAQKQMEQ